jgi:hypothetical protein
MERNGRLVWLALRLLFDQGHSRTSTSLDIDETVLPNLTAEDLKELGVASLCETFPCPRLPAKCPIEPMLMVVAPTKCRRQ